MGEEVGTAPREKLVRMTNTSSSDSEKPKSSILQSDFETLLSQLSRTPGVTARQLSVDLRRRGHTQFTSKLVNQILYRLLATQFVERDGTGDKPRWTASSTWGSRTSRNSSANIGQRPLRTESVSAIIYKIADTEVRLLEEDTLSPNDSYIQPDWVGSHIVVSVNTNHPFWKLRLTSDTSFALFRLIAAVDAYVQWKVAQLTEPPDATEVLKMRDYAFRFCTLETTEQFKND
jgi:hypothetical protein